MKDKRAFGRPDDPFTYRIRLKRAPWLPTKLQLELLDGCDSGDWVPKATQVVPVGQVEVAWKLAMPEWADAGLGYKGKSCKFRIKDLQNGRIIGPWDGPKAYDPIAWGQWYQEQGRIDFVSNLLQMWGDQVVYAKIGGKNMLFYKVGALAPEELKELIIGRWVQAQQVQVQQDVDELIHSWDAAEVARVINEIWERILEQRDTLSPEDLRTFITGLVTEYYRENEDFKNFVDALAEGAKGLELLRSMLTSLHWTGTIAEILLAILESPELPPGLQVLEAFFWLMLQYPSSQESLLSLLGGVDRIYQDDVVILAVMLYGFAIDPAFQDVGLTASFATAFFGALSGALGTGNLDSRIWGFLQIYLIGLGGGIAVDEDILEEKYADAVATALVTCNAISYGWSFIGIGFLKGHAMVQMMAIIDGKEYHFYVHADAAFGPEDLEEIPSFIEDVIDKIGDGFPDQPGITEGIIIPIFEAAEEEIEQLKEKINELTIPANFPILIVWVDEETSRVGGECVAGCEGMSDDEIQNLLDQAARAQFGVGLGEIWDPPPDPAAVEAEVAAFMEKVKEETGYEILSRH